MKNFETKTSAAPPGYRLPKAPAHLSKEAKSWWDKVVSAWELDDPSLLLLESALELFDRMREAQKAIRAKGLTVKDRFGQVKANPCCAVEIACKAAMVRTLKAIGLDLEPLNPG